MIEQLNELQLSNDLTTIETEIKSYQNIAGQSIFEIGRRLKHVKENDLAHGEFGKWLEKVGLDKYQASRFIKVADEQPKLRPSANLGLKALYQNEMTNKEREEFKRQIKQRDEQNAQFWHNKAEHNLYRFFLEIKKIRDERLFSELGFSDFDEYCQSAWSLKRRVVDERIQIANSFSEENFKRYSARLGHKKTLLLTTMNEEQRDQSLNEGVPTERGYKPYDKATQKK